jgi:hypothetical protein
MDTCSNNQTNIGQMTDVDGITDYAQACICCSFSAIISAYDKTPELKATLPFYPSVANDIIQYLGHLP